MDNLTQTGLWLNRIVLSFVSVLFATIGFKNIIHPLERSAEAGIMLNSATALSVARVSMGAFPLGFAIIIFISIFSNPKLYQGILSVFILVTITTVVRIISLRIDGHSDFGLKVLVPEIILTILSAIGLFLELRRRKLNPNIKAG
jgi:hypothetical protein